MRFILMMCSLPNCRPTQMVYSQRQSARPAPVPRCSDWLPMLLIRSTPQQKSALPYRYRPRQSCPFTICRDRKCGCFRADRSTQAFTERHGMGPINRAMTWLRGCTSPCCAQARDHRFARCCYCAETWVSGVRGLSTMQPGSSEAWTLSYLATPV